MQTLVNIQQISQHYYVQVKKDGFATGNPKPQYVPVKLPWTYGQRFTSALIPGDTTAYCEEYENCFGTYLPASTAQVRRTTATVN